MDRFQIPTFNTLNQMPRNSMENIGKFRKQENYHTIQSHFNPGKIFATSRSKLQILIQMEAHRSYLGYTWIIHKIQDKHQNS